MSAASGSEGAHAPSVDIGVADNGDASPSQLSPSTPTDSYTPNPGLSPTQGKTSTGAMALAVVRHLICRWSSTPSLSPRRVLIYSPCRGVAGSRFVFVGSIVGAMQGFERFDREFLDTRDLWHLVPVGSVYRFLAENRRRLFPDEMFADLFGSGRGRPSIPGPVIGAVMVLQALECLSDREAIQRLRRDIAWKAATGLSLTHGGFHPTVLTLWRARLRASEKPERIFDAVRRVVAESGVLATRDRRALDSTILHDAVATQDTVTMISSQIRRCRRLIPEAADLVLVAHDYESKTKPSCDWSDPDSRSELVDGLVSDGLAVIEAVEDVKLDPEQADAVGLLGVVTGQDVEPDPHREGRWRIARRVAKDRTISTVDTEARHGHKTRTRKRDGYKAHVATEPETGLVTAAVLTAANTPDADSIADLVAEAPPGAEIVRGFGVRVRCGTGNVRRTWSHPGGETNRAQTPHRRRVPPRRLLYRHRSPDGDVSRRAHRPPTSRWYRPVREAVQRLPPAGTVHHLGAWTDHHSRPTPRPSGGEQSTVGQRRNAGHLPELAAVRGTDHRLAHPRESQTRSLPRNPPQPAMAHHPNSSHQPTTPHQPRTRPHHHRLGHQLRLEPQKPRRRPKEPHRRHQPTQNTTPQAPTSPTTPTQPTRRTR